jgi:CRISPR/Cas system-associated protein Csx1
MATVELFSKYEYNVPEEILHMHGNAYIAKFIHGLRNYLCSVLNDSDRSIKIMSISRKAARPHRLTCLIFSND